MTRQGARAGGRAAERIDASFGGAAAAELRRSRSFVLRFWVEPRDGANENGIVRGCVVAVESGDEHYFPTPQAALAFLARAVGASLSGQGEPYADTEGTADRRPARVPSEQRPVRPERPQRGAHGVESGEIGPRRGPQGGGNAQR